jgi:FlaA1/EpsC-like NDP-sugar epimerase
VGLRPGEKLTEQLLGSEETVDRAFHPLIMHVTCDPLHPAALDALHQSRSADDARSTLASLAGGSLPAR